LDKWKDNFEDMKAKVNTAIGKKILSLVREGDYAHPGEEEAIDLVFKNVPIDSDRKILDVGCGLFGTANYLQSKGYGKITGIDLNVETLKVAKERYPDQDIRLCDVNNAFKVLEDKYDLIYLFNSFYLFQDQQKALCSLRKVSKEKGELILFAYADPGNYNAGNVEVPCPLKLDKIEGMLNDAGWKLASIDDISHLYIKWYKELCERIISKKNEITELSNSSVYEYFLEQYQTILRYCKEASLKGVIVRAVGV
jgi:SAM-dependent methyltransferase